MFFVKVFYKQCSNCKRTWSAQLSHADVIRVGKETFVCKCGTAWPTGHAEWAHLTPRMRRSYFLSTSEIGVSILLPFTFGLFAFVIAQNKWMGLLWGILSGLVMAAVFVAVMWALKLIIVKFSLRRCQPDILSTPAGSDFFDFFRDPISTIASTGDSVLDEIGLIVQFRSVRPISWVFAGLAVAVLPWMEYTWPFLLLCLVLFLRSLRKLRPPATANIP